MDRLHRLLEEEYHNLDLWYFISFIAGIASYFSFNYKPSISALIICIFTSLIFLYIKHDNLIIRFLMLILIFMNLGAASAKYRLSSFHPILLEHPVIVNINGIINSIKPTDKGWQIFITVKKIDKELQLTTHKIRLNTSAKLLNNANTGDEIEVKAKLFNLSGRLLPQTYDFGFYLYLDNVHASGYALNKVNIIHTRPRGSIEKLRQKIYQRLISIGSQTTGNFIAAILLGESKAIKRTLLNDMRLAGISHILCVSGLHLSLVAMLTFGVGRVLLNLSNFIAYNFNIKIIAAYLSFLFSLGYLSLSGHQIAATRAFIMTSIFIISIITGYKTNLLRALSLAAIMIVLPKPEYIFYPAFQLSFIAVLSLISGYEFYKNNSYLFGPKHGFLGQVKFYFLSNIYSSFLASIITAPIILYHFYIFSSYSILNNLIAVPIMSFFLMPLSLFALILMPLGLDIWLISLLDFFINIIIKFASFANTLPSATIYFGHITSNSLIIFLLGFFWLCIWQTKVRILGIVIMLSAFICMLNTHKPDFIFDYKLNSLGVKSGANKLIVYSDGISTFVSNYWSNWYGQNQAIILPLKKDTYRCSSNKTLMINDSSTSPCQEADIQININKYCPGKYLEINKDFLDKAKLITIYCTAGICRVEP